MTTKSVDKVRFTSKMSIKEDSVVLIIRLRPEMKEIDTIYTETHPSRHDSTFFPDPGNRMIPDSQNPTVRAKEKGQRW